MALKQPNNCTVYIPVQYIQLLRKMRMMMVKIENFNQTGVMEGATAIQGHNFTSMKQDVLDLCDSRYDAKMKKCCAEQSIEVLLATCIYPTLRIVILRPIMIMNLAHNAFYRILMNCKSE